MPISSCKVVKISQFFAVFLLSYLCSTLSKVSSIKILDIKVPHYVPQQSDVLLSCRYSLENDTLYALKWLFNNREFYRYGPIFSPVKQNFNVSGPTVDLSNSYQGDVLLPNISVDATGRYKCEVSAERTFQTVVKDEMMYVLENSGNSRNMIRFNSFMVLIQICLVHVSCY